MGEINDMSLLKMLFSSSKKKPQKKAKRAIPAQKARITEMNRKIEEMRRENERIDGEVNKEIAELAAARDAYKQDGNIEKLISIYENLLLDLERPQWNAFGYCLSLADFYVKANRHDEAWGYLNKMVQHITTHPGCNWEMYKVRFAQFKVLKDEKRHKDAFCMLVMSCVVRSNELRQPYFARNSFLKDAKTTAKGLGLSENDLTEFADQLEAKIMSRSLHERGVSEFCSDYFASHGL